MTVPMTRRDSLLKMGGGLGLLGLAALLEDSPSVGVAEAASKRSFNLTPKMPHFAPKAKSVIFLYMGGGPSQMDLLDPKPELTKYHGQNAPFEVDQRGLNPSIKLMGSPYKFSKHGESGLDFSELLPNIAAQADDLAVIRSAWTTRNDHDNARIMIHTGRPGAGFPTVGSWATYGLGTMNQNLPAYICLDGTFGGVARSATSSAFLPAMYQATKFNTGGVPIYDLKTPAEITSKRQREYLALTQKMNRIHQQPRRDELELDARIRNFELAARMQIAAMDQVDISQESPATLAMYGVRPKSPVKSMERQCLMARRLVESGVRFVHVLRSDWDHHGDLKKRLPKSCKGIDQPVAALIQDLKERGLLDSTLVVWSGEFGRQPVVEGNKFDGRDHNPHGFSMFMAGGGIKGGTIYGATDDFGYAAVENRMSMADLHATIMHLLGLDHRKLIYRFEGRDETITGVEPAKVVKELFA